jgi:DNA-binding CsgD family transcriptional regulator
VVPHLAEGLRAGLLHSAADTVPLADAPGLLTLAEDGSLLALSDAAARWLQELGYPSASGGRAPEPVECRGGQAALDRDRFVVSQGGAAPAGWSRVRAVGSSPRLVVARAEPQVAVLLEEGGAGRGRLPAHAGLRPHRSRAAGLVCRGLSTSEISAQLHISANTAQDHLKSVFANVGVASRGQLVAAILQQQYAPRMRSGAAVGPDGFFR